MSGLLTRSGPSGLGGGTPTPPRSATRRGSGGRSSEATRYRSQTRDVCCSPSSVSHAVLRHRWARSVVEVVIVDARLPRSTFAPIADELLDTVQFGRLTASRDAPIRESVPSRSYRRPSSGVAAWASTSRPTGLIEPSSPYPDYADDDAFRARFLRESKLAASIDHPNIIPIYEAGQIDGTFFLAMRYVEGIDLQQRLVSGPLDPRYATTIVAQVASALDAAHRAGLVHRDVKPGNVLAPGQALDGTSRLPDRLRADQTARQPIRSTQAGGFLELSRPSGSRQCGRRPCRPVRVAGMAVAPERRGTIPARLGRRRHQRPPPRPTTVDQAPRRSIGAGRRHRARYGRLPADRFPDCRAFADGPTHAALGLPTIGTEHQSTHALEAVDPGSGRSGHRACLPGRHRFRLAGGIRLDVRRPPIRPRVRGAAPRCRTRRVRRRRRSARAPPRPRAPSPMRQRLPC